MQEHEYYTTHSRISTPGPYAFLFDDVPHDLAGIARVTQGLVYHFAAGPAIFGYCPPPERMQETNTRYMELILARLLQMGNRPLGEERAFEHRLVGCCRDNALLACAMLRHQGREARLRYGFAGYLVPQYWVDHVLVEVWNEARWQCFDPGIPSLEHVGLDVLDLSEPAFVAGGRAWQLCRRDGADPTRFGLGPDDHEASGWWFIRRGLQLDVAALMKQELLWWDRWGFGQPDSVLRAEDELLLDHLAALSQADNSAALRRLYLEHPQVQAPTAYTLM
jgi:hypothetical protein